MDKTTEHYDIRSRPHKARRVGAIRHLLVQDDCASVHPLGRSRSIFSNRRAMTANRALPHANSGISHRFGRNRRRIAGNYCAQWQYLHGSAPFPMRSCRLQLVSTRSAIRRIDVAAGEAYGNAQTPRRITLRLSIIDRRHPGADPTLCRTALIAISDAARSCVEIVCPNIRPCGNPPAVPRAGVCVSQR
jgi:hypothetical protein